jgi:hypothetical protein
MNYSRYITAAAGIAGGLAATAWVARETKVVVRETKGLIRETAEAVGHFRELTQQVTGLLIDKADLRETWFHARRRAIKKLGEYEIEGSVDNTIEASQARIGPAANAPASLRP